MKLLALSIVAILIWKLREPLLAYLSYIDLHNSNVGTHDFMRALCLLFFDLARKSMLLYLP